MSNLWTLVQNNLMENLSSSKYEGLTSNCMKNFIIFIELFIKYCTSSGKIVCGGKLYGISFDIKYSAIVYDIIYADGFELIVC